MSSLSGYGAAACAINQEGVSVEGSSFKAEDFKIEGLVGTFSPRIQLVVNRLKAVNCAVRSGSPIPKSATRALLLYGPTGSGKTTLARKIAEATGSEVLFIKGSKIIDGYLAGGSKAIDNKFAEAKDLIANGCPSVVIITDEVDTIGVETNGIGDGAKERDAALKELWSNIDAIKNTDRILVISTTNKFKELSPTLLDRYGSYTVEIKNPDEKMRLEVLKHYWKQELEGCLYEESVLKKIASNSEGLSTRSLEKIIEESLVCAQAAGLKKPNEKILLDHLNEIKTRVFGTTKERVIKNLKSVYSGTKEVLKDATIAVVFVAGVLTIIVLGKSLRGGQSQDKK
jgi:AAA+ superfamily predicted ATPase